MKPPNHPSISNTIVKPRRSRTSGKRITAAAAKIGAATTIAVGSPKKLLKTLIAVAAMAIAANTTAGTISGRRR